MPLVTGVQTCALPISARTLFAACPANSGPPASPHGTIRTCKDAFRRVYREQRATCFRLESARNREDTSTSCPAKPIRPALLKQFQRRLHCPEPKRAENGRASCRARGWQEGKIS